MSEIEDTLASLGTKLDGLDLTDEERDALLALLDAAASTTDDEVEGFGMPIPISRERASPFCICLPSFGVLPHFHPPDPGTRGIILDD